VKLLNGRIVTIKELNHTGRSASVKLVRIAGQKYFVLKTDSIREAAAQIFFNQQLNAHHIPTLAIYNHPDLQPGQILLEYIKGSPTLGGALTEGASREWGALVARMHAITTPEFIVLTAHGDKVAADWKTYLEKYIQAAFLRHLNLVSGLDAQTLQSIEVILNRLLTYTPKVFSITHGDLHVHNVLVRDNSLVLYDKYADFLMAPPSFDLGVVYAEAFNGAAYPQLGLSTKEQQQLFAAFMSGYGPLPPEQQEWLDHFILLRAFYRWPNRFAPHSGEVIKLLTRKLGV
jgi:Ser/Thr protein kinase RdoA (MazF antagonist)